MGREVAAEEDRAAAPRGARVDDVARNRLLAYELEAPPEMVDALAAHVGVGERRAGVTAPRQRARATFLDQPLPLELHLADRVAELGPVGHLPELDAAREVLEPELVVEVELVEQRGGEQVEVPVGGPAHQVAPPVIVVVLEEDRLQSRRFRDVEQHVLAGGALERVEQRRELRLLLEPRLLHDDRKPEVHRQHEHAQRAVVLGDEVVERGHHPVARAALEHGVVVQRVDAARSAAPASVPGRIPFCSYGWRNSSGTRSGT